MNTHQHLPLCNLVLLYRNDGFDIPRQFGKDRRFFKRDDTSRLLCKKLQCLFGRSTAVTRSRELAGAAPASPAGPAASFELHPPVESNSENATTETIENDLFILNLL